ncbi:MULTISPECIES: TonB-dependent receptor [unclassified Phenylobacterium]|uniref:TonB-dependent receptor n=1 Tax=unclassified Phenylobacterium TaxID=2640670 RepID=UPI000AB40C38|nr:MULTISPECIES: TonB-dependent receptor [unclassified Phenylobacterium]
MMPITTRAVWMLGAASCALVVATPALSQDKPDPKVVAALDTLPMRDSSIDEVVVTARRVEENVQQVPVAVSVVSQERLQDLVINNTQDLNKLASGLQVGACVGTRRGCSPIVRAQSGAAGTLSYFAEVPNFPRALFDLQNVQVLKGPQGTLFGETTTGGAILYTPRKPTNEFSGYVDASLGNYDYRALDVAVGGAIIPDKVLFRVAGRLRQRDGFTTAIFSDGSPPEDYDDVNRLEWRASLVLRPFENFENYTIYSGSHEDSNGSGNQVRFVDERFISPALRNVIPANNPTTAARYEFMTGRAPPPGLTWSQILRDGYNRQNAAGPYVMFTNLHAPFESKSHGIVNQTRWDVSDNLAIRNIFGIYWAKVRDGTDNGDAVDGPLYDGYAIRPRGATEVRSDDVAYQGGWPGRTWSNEIQALGQLFDERVDWQAGFYYRSAKARDFNYVTTGLRNAYTVPSGTPSTATYCSGAAPNGVGLPAGTDCTKITRTESENYAVYAQANLKLTDTLRITGGVRRNWDTDTVFDSATATNYVTFKGVRIPILYPDPQRLPGASVLTTVNPLSKAWTYTLSADWQVNDRTLVYLAHRTGYKGGGVNTTVTDPADPRRLFGPERVKDIELGLKADWSLGGITGRTNIAAYHQWYDDVQRQDFVPPLVLRTNAAKATIKGFELDTTIRFNDWFSVTGNASLTDASYDKWTETQRCSSQFWRPQCTSSTQTFVIDHAKGVITGLGPTPILFKPDSFRGVAKWKWSIQPEIDLKAATGEDITFGANIYYQGSYATSDPNSSIYAGLTPGPTEEGIYGNDSQPYFTAPVTLVDLRADWRHIRGSNFSVGARVTNLLDKVYNQGPAAGFPISGAAPSVIGEPRMWYVEGRWEF